MAIQCILCNKIDESIDAMAGKVIATEQKEKKKEKENNKKQAKNFNIIYLVQCAPISEHDRGGTSNVVSNTSNQRNSSNR